MAKKAEKKKIPAWVWIFNLGLAVSFVLFLNYLSSLPETSETNNKEPSPTTKVVKEEPKQKSKETKFDFYEVLPETKVEAAKIEEYTPKKPPENLRYFLQTGSFRSVSDAEKQKAMIAFQGLKAEIKEINLKKNDTWYRVQIGPYTSRSKMNSAIDRLVSINIQPLVKKKKHTKGDD